MDPDAFSADFLKTQGNIHKFRRKRLYFCGGLFYNFFILNYVRKAKCRAVSLRIVQALQERMVLPMAFCPQCGANVADGVPNCPQCGAPMGAAPAFDQGQGQQNQQFQQYQQQPYQQYQQQPPYAAPVPYPAVDPKDHTAEFDAKDISDNKVYAMAPYLLGTIGIIIALLAAQKSDFTTFHVRQAVKITIVQVLLIFCCIIPILGWIFAGVCNVIIFVLEIIMFFRVCKGKAIEVPIISNLGFLK